MKKSSPCGVWWQEKEKQSRDSQVNRSSIFLDLFLALKEIKRASYFAFFNFGKSEIKKQFHMAQLS
jgi:hypothetical protein